MHSAASAYLQSRHAMREQHVQKACPKRPCG